MKKLKLWWKRLWCVHNWEYNRVINPYEEWFTCLKCGKQKDV